jgi:tRNA pseudouridine38-40 synthase
MWFFVWLSFTGAIGACHKKGNHLQHIFPASGIFSTMNKFMALVEYDGTNYHGWQLQKGVPTVQAGLELALERIVGAPTRVYGAGRTDAGVHAKGQVIHFSAAWSLSTGELERACNALLPPDIAVRDLKVVPEGFHARHSARSKTYVYHVLNLPLRSPVQRLYTLHVPSRLELGAMQEAAAHVKGTHDFAAFGAPTDGTTSTVREVLDAFWESSDPEGIVSFSIHATGFLRYMVRSLVGTLLQVGTGKTDPDEFLAILRSCDRSRSGPTARPQGLFLMSVVYPAGDARDESGWGKRKSADGRALIS